MSQAAVKLEKLLIQEISGVDNPANEIPGFMVMKAEGTDDDVSKSSKFKTGRGMGPDESWDVGAAEKRVREATGAEDAPNAEYASCFLWYDGSAPDKFGSYKFLVVDVADGELKVMPQALRAAASRLPGSKLSDSDKASVGATLDKLKAKAGIGEGAEKSADGEVEPSTLARIRDMIWPARKDEVDMTSEELKAALDERDTALVEKFAEVVKSAVPAEGAPAETTPTEAPAAPAAPEAPAPEAEAPVALTAEDVTKAVEEALAPYNDILEKTLDRIEAIEARFGIVARKSLDGQESVEGEATQTEKTTTPQGGEKDGPGIAKALFSKPVGASIGSYLR